MEAIVKAQSLQADMSDKAQRLRTLEASIARNSFKQRGEALAEVLSNELYLPQFSSFDNYCSTRWGFKRAHAYRLIDAAEVARQLSPIGDIKKESHARMLVRLPGEQREAAFRRALEKATAEGRAVSTRDFAVEPQPHLNCGIHIETSTGEQLKQLWTLATEAERKTFLAWATPGQIDEGDQPEPGWECGSCGATFDEEEDAVTLYECGECGTQFTQETSANGKHQCPDCNRFGRKVSDLGCPECNEGELETTSRSEA